MMLNADVFETGHNILFGIVGAFAWPALAQVSTVAFAMIQTMWYCSLVLGIAAVALGLQQSVFLHRIACLQDADALLAAMLSYDLGNGSRYPRWDQVILWQCAVGLLEFCMYTWLGGFIVFLWDVAKSGAKSSSASNKVVSAQYQLLYIYQNGRLILTQHLVLVRLPSSALDRSWCLSRFT